MAQDDTQRPERRPADQPAQAKPAVKRDAAGRASRRPSAASIANRPSAAGQRRSRRRTPKPNPTVGGAAAEVETSKSRWLEVLAEPTDTGTVRSGARSSAQVAGKAPGGASAMSGDGTAKSATTSGEGTAKPSAKSGDGTAQPSAQSGKSAAEPSSPSGKAATKPSVKDVEPVPTTAPNPSPDSRPIADAETASAQGRNVKYSSAHPENSLHRGTSSARARSTRPRRGRRGGAKVREPETLPTNHPEAPTAELLRRKREQLKQADWHTDDDNPYLQEYVEGPQDEHWYEDEEVSPVVPVRDISPRGKRRTSAAIRSRGLIAVLGVFAAMAALALFVWITRSVEFTLNGTDVSTTYGTSLADYIQQHELSFAPGNLVSVGGTVLQEGAGDAFAATVDGVPYRPAEAGDVHLTGGENVELGNGLDIMEDHDVEVIEALPKLEFDGDIGAVSYVSQWGKPGTQERLTGKQSGEVALGDFIEAPTNTIVTRLSVMPSDNRKLVALTFDDGPSSYTPQYLDILAQYGAKATFFMFGPSAEQDPEMVKRVVEAGHQVCNHTSVHQDLSAMDAEQLQNELRTTFEQVDNASGQQTTVLRPPWSIFTHDCWLNSGGLMSASIIYTSDSRDWDQPGVSSIVDYALEGVAPGSIILMHDGGYPLSQDLDALPQILAWLRDNDYEMVTLSELLASDPAISQIAATCDDPMPEGSAWPTEFAETAEGE